MKKDFNQNTEPQFLQNAGEMGKLVLTHDWTNNPVGPIHQWPQSLRATLGIMLHSAFPMFLFWGKDQICFYNDAYRPSLGVNGKHPAIGKPANEVWPEIWELTNSLIEEVYRTGSPQWFEDRLVPIYRNGRLEDVYWTFSHSPAYGDNDEIEGVLVTCMETTPAVVGRRQIEQTVASRTMELERANTSIQQANDYLQDIINSFKQPLQILEPVFENGEIIDFRFKLTNQAYAAYANTTPESIKGERVSKIALAHAASHDLKEPVREIQIFADRLRTQLFDQLTERDLVMFGKIEIASKRMGHLIDDLLLYSQMSLVPLEKELVDLNENIQQVIDDLEVSIQETNASIILSDLPIVSGYKRQLHQMFQNLISNSLKYHNPGVPLQIHISSQPSTENGRPYHLIDTPARKRHARGQWRGIIDSKKSRRESSRYCEG